MKLKQLRLFRRVLQAKSFVIALVLLPVLAMAQERTWEMELGAAVKVLESNPEAQSAFVLQELLAAATWLKDDPAGSVQKLRLMEPVIKDRLTVPFEDADAEAVVLAALGNDGVGSPAAPFNKDELPEYRKGIEQAFAAVDLSIASVPDVIAYYAVTVWAALQGDQRVVHAKPTMHAVRDQVVLMESQRASLTGHRGKLPKVRNALVAQALLLQEALKQAQRADDVPALRKAVDEKFGRLLDGLRLGAPAGPQLGPNMFEANG